MKASIEHWDTAGEMVFASLEAEGHEERFIRVPCYEIEEPRGWHTDRTDTVLRVEEMADVLDEDGEPSDRMELSDAAQEALNDALAPLFAEEQMWRGIDAAS